MTRHTVSGSPANTGGWQVVVYETPSGKHPALEYLSAASVPDQPRRELLLTVFAVAEMGPLNFPTGTARWRLMHKAAKKGEVDMSGIFEARDQHNRVVAGKGIPNLGTIADVAEALDVYIDVRVKPQPRNGKRHAAIEVHEAAA